MDSDAGLAVSFPLSTAGNEKQVTSDATDTHQTEKGKQRKTTSSESRIRDKGKGLDKKIAGSQVSKEAAIGSAGPAIWADRAAKARAARLVKLANLREERERAVEVEDNASPASTVPDQPRRTRQKPITASLTASTPPAEHVRQTTNVTNNSTDLSSPPPIMLKISRKGTKANKSDSENDMLPLKEYMEAGFYCQDNNAKSPHNLISKILFRRAAEEKAKSKPMKRGGTRVMDINRPTFPPLPYDYGYQLFFDEQQDFVLPYNIRREAESGRLDGKKKPAAYSKLRANVFPERSRMTADIHAICNCSSKSDCGDNCINRIMNYLCGRNCPCGEKCTNKSLAKRKGPSVKVNYTGSRGFGLTAVEDIKEGDFVVDYRGEIIPLDVYQERCRNEYAISKNFYALAYDGDEVIDAGARGNEARFINHSCNPNLAVYRCQNLGDGLEEYEVGMWASRDIAAGEELSYDYNFDAFGVAEGSVRVECLCGAPNCVGYLGRKSGEKSAKQIALDIAAAEASRARVAKIKAKRAPKNAELTATKTTIKQKGNAAAGPSNTNSLTFWKTNDSDKNGAAKQKKGPRKILPANQAKTGDRVDNTTNQLPTPESMDSGAFEIPAPVDFSKSPSAPIIDTTKGKKKPRQSMPNPTRPTKPLPRSRAKTPEASTSKTTTADDDTLPSGPANDREMSPVPFFLKRTWRPPRKSQPSGNERPDIPPPTKVLSGWANWLRKQAGEIPRTEAQWQDIRQQRRRGEQWMNDLIAEFGRLPSKGIPGQAGFTVSQADLEQKRKELDEKGISWAAKGVRARTIVHSDLAPEPVPAPAPAPKKRPRNSSNPATSAHGELNVETGSEDSDSDQEDSRTKAKQEAIRKRNGAPMGWAYEPITGPPAQAIDTIPVDLPPRRQTSRIISYAD